MLAKADTGASQHYWTHCNVKLLTKVTSMINGPMVKLPDSTVIQATHRGPTPLHPTLSDQAQQAHSFPKMMNSSLTSIGHICDDNCTAIFNKQNLKTDKDKDLSIVSGKAIIKGTRNKTDGLWDIHIQHNETIPPVITNEASNFIIRKDKTKPDLAKYIHACLFSPPTSTLQKAVRKDHFLSWPGIHNLHFEKLLHTPKSSSTWSLRPRTS
eukprot:9654784-Ditylum_brightwellii.AAC.1